MVVFVSILGLLIGSFLNVLIDRLPKGQNVFWGRSHCDYCKRTLRWYELIPLVSFFWQRGKCVRCHRSLSWQYPLIEAMTGIGYFLIWGMFNQSTTLLVASLILFSSLLVITISDLKYQIIPDSMIITGGIGTILLFLNNVSYAFIAEHVLTGLATSVFFLFLWLLTKKRGIGLGDVKISFLLGLLLGYPEIIMALYIAFLTGAIVGVILILGGKKKLKSKIAFGPFLILGVAGTLCFNPILLSLWHTIF